MKSLLIDTLEKLNYPIQLQGTLGLKEYPDTFFAFWNPETYEKYYDNVPVSREWVFWLYLYSTNARVVESEMDNAIKLLRDAGFIIEGYGSDVASDVVTHTGRMITAHYIEKLEASK